MVSPLVRCFSAPSTLEHIAPFTNPADMLPEVRSESLAISRPHYASSADSEISRSSLPPRIKTREQSPRTIARAKSAMRGFVKHWNIVASTLDSPSESTSPRSSPRQSPVEDFSLHGMLANFYMDMDPIASRPAAVGLVPRPSVRN